jgi:peptidoglycan endopeptidase LytF
MFGNMKYLSLPRIVAVLVSHICLTPALAAARKGPAPGAYTVKSGDTFAKIARANRISLGELLAANRIANPDRILLGQRIVIPGARTAAANGAPTKTRTPPTPAMGASKQLPLPTTGKRVGTDDTTVNLAPPTPRNAPYVVQSGDTLSRIQRRTGVPVSSLLRLNGLTEASVIYPGQKLRITAGPGTETVAQQRAVRRPNREAGIPVIIDNTREVPAGPASTPAGSSFPAAPTGTAPHKVESGETFTSISRLYGVTGAQLASANRGVDPHRIRIGQTLMVPGQPLKPQPKPLMVRADGRILAGRPDPLATGSSGDDELPAGLTRTGYLVEEGETIQQIAQRFHTTEGVVRRLNRMSESDNVYAGRYILVPFIRQAPQPARYATRDA